MSRRVALRPGNPLETPLMNRAPILRVTDGRLGGTRA